MFTYAQFLRLVEIFREVYMIVESVPFTVSLPYALISWCMILYVLLYVYIAVTRHKRLVVSQRQNRQLRLENEYLTELTDDLRAELWQHRHQHVPGPPPHAVPVAILVPNAALINARNEDDGEEVEEEVERPTMAKALENMQKLTKSLKHDSVLLNTMEAKHKGQEKKLVAEDAAAIKLLEDCQKEKVLANTKRREAETAALRAAHALAHPDPTSEQMDARSVELHEMHMTNSNADGLAQGTFDTEMMDLHVAHKEGASQLADSQRSEKRAFEDKCLHEHSRNMRARY